MREESERLEGQKVRQIRENTQRVQGVPGEEESLWRGSDEKGLGEGLGMFSPLLLFLPLVPLKPYAVLGLSLCGPHIVAKESGVWPS